MQADDGRVLYEGWSVRPGLRICVTTRWCFASGGRYAVAELEVLGTSRGRRDVLHVRRIAGLFVVLALLVVVGFAICSGWTRGIWIALGVTVVATAAVTALPGVIGRFLHRPFQIWAQYRGAPVLLFETEDREQYGQVARALIRARELSRD
jgi:hypothetical protein